MIPRDAKEPDETESDTRLHILWSKHENKSNHADNEFIRPQMRDYLWIEAVHPFQLVVQSILSDPKAEKLCNAVE